MNRIVLLIAIAGAAAVTTTGVASAAAGPVAHWRFDENGGTNAADSTGNGNTGTLQGGVSWIAGKRQSAVQFDGSTGAVRVPSGTALEPANVTVSAWVKRSGTPGEFKYIVGKGAFGCLSSSYGLYTGRGGGLFFYVSDGTDVTRSADAGLGVWDGAWHHVAGTFDGQAVHLYVDGAEVGTPVPRTAPISYTLQDPGDELLGVYGGCGGLASTRRRSGTAR